MVLDIPGGLFEQRDVRETSTSDIKASAVPVGGVIAWLKNFTNTPALPSNFVECNGQVLSDADSVYNGQTIPSLNATNSFLRGNATSAGTGGSSTHTLTIAQMPAHTHNIYYNADLRLGSSGTLGATLESVNTGNSLGVTSTGGGGAHENKPPYYNIVWIMRIK